mmetsp:Transcript_13317/g.38848  ORF Transcript_13317/g.38848 Transcript_13317/m.38848 type:complete len:219 (+) Transcript_13317:102-758(+)
MTIDACLSSSPWTSPRGTPAGAGGSPARARGDQEEGLHLVRLPAHCIEVAVSSGTDGFHLPACLLAHHAPQVRLRGPPWPRPAKPGISIGEGMQQKAAAWSDAPRNCSNVALLDVIIADAVEYSRVHCSVKHHSPNLGHLVQRQGICPVHCNRTPQRARTAGPLLGKLNSRLHDVECCHLKALLSQEDGIVTRATANVQHVRAQDFAVHDSHRQRRLG